MFDRAPPDRRASPRRRPSEAPSIANQLRQRQAVAALRERMMVRIASQVYRDGTLLSTRVAIGGEFYDVSERQLARLRQGCDAGQP